MEIMEKWQLQQLQGLDLETKIRKTELRIKEWYEHWNGQVYTSFSGGKDSTVLLDICRRLYPNIPAVFVDTGLEYPEVREFVKIKRNITWLKPEKNFKQVIKEFGWCYPSKDVSSAIYYAKKGSDWALKKLKGLNNDGTKSQFKKRYKKWEYLLNSPVIISDKCCRIIKEQPIHKYEKRTGNHPITGMMASESQRRKDAWFKNGCNAFNVKRPISSPLSYWNEQDILKYITIKKIDYASIYGDILFEDGKYATTGEKRTGCMFCPVGCHLDKPNKYQRMKKTHPKQYDYCLRDEAEGGLGLKKALDYWGVPY